MTNWEKQHKATGGTLTMEWKRRAKNIMIATVLALTTETVPARRDVPHGTQLKKAGDQPRPFCISKVAEDLS